MQLDTFLTLDDVIAAIGLSKSNIYEMVERGEFPAQMKIGRSSRWSAAEIAAWMKKQAGNAQRGPMPDSVGHRRKRLAAGEPISA